MNTPCVVEQHDRFQVVRDDLLVGGSKVRFLPAIIKDAREVVFGGPFCGGAPLAIAATCKQLGRKATLFFAQRAKLHPRQRKALELGAEIKWVPMGFISNVQAKARSYADRSGALFLPLGFDRADAREAMKESMAELKARIGSPPQVWSAMASGMLTRCLAEVFVESEVVSVAVGLKTRWSKQAFPRNVRIIESRYKQLADPCFSRAPFSICEYYEAKAWEVMQQQGAQGALFWNVVGRD